MLYRTLSKVISILFMLSYLPVLSQPFPCDGSIMFSYNQGLAPTQTYKVIFGPFGVIYYSQVKVFQSGNFNAIGFNPLDNYMYGVRVNTNEIVRLRADGSYDVVGKAPMIDLLDSSAGDCTPEGQYVCYDNQLNQILVFDVTDQFALVDKLNLFWDPTSKNSGPFTTRINDFAIDPTNPNVAYSYQGDYFHPGLKPDATRGFLLRINLDFQDPNVGMVTPIAHIPTDVTRQMGSLMFSSDGSLFGYGSTSTRPNQGQNTLIFIDKNSGKASAHGITGPNAQFSDGCSCPYNLTFENTAIPSDVFCTNSEFSFVLTVNNRFFKDITGVTITDTIPEGMVIEAVSGDFVGIIQSGTGAGTRVVTITDVKIPAKKKVNINIKVRVIDLPIDFIANQAYLKNLPERFGGEIVSDDPSTGFVGDPTRFYSNAQNINEVKMSITHPTDCLDADNASALISSPILVPGESYKVILRNQKWEESVYDVVIDENNAFFLDHMRPGKYKLTHITPSTSLCGFALKDTTIDIIAPNELLQAWAESNSPICETESLKFSATMSPQGSIQWRGPSAFGSDEANPIIRSASLDQSGTYEMTATYGVCEQIRKLEVNVAPEIEATISGKEKYCEREAMELTAEGNGEIQSFQWYGPNGITDNGPDLRVLYMASNKAGKYEVIVDNGFCQDTAVAMITVNPSPTITLPEYIESAFCEPLILKPKLESVSQVDYVWSPQEGLDCENCPNPEVLIPILPRYNVNVTNEYACRDSATVDVYLSKDKLIYIPNAFSPNADGVNDFFYVTPGCGLVRIKKMDIFSRSGAMIYTIGPIDQYEPSIFWDGSIAGQKGDPGVYRWQIELELMDGTIQKLSGNVTLVL